MLHGNLNPGSHPFQAPPLHDGTVRGHDGIRLEFRLIVSGRNHQGGQAAVPCAPGVTTATDGFLVFLELHKHVRM